MSGSAWRGPKDAVQAAPYLANGYSRGGIGQAATSVVVADRGASQVDSRGREPVSGCLGEVGAHRDRVGAPTAGAGTLLAERSDAAVRAPAFPSAPGGGVDGAGGRSVGGGDRGGDPLDVLRGERRTAVRIGVDEHWRR